MDGLRANHGSIVRQPLSKGAVFYAEVSPDYSRPEPEELLPSSQATATA
jgi:hypothetical protein